MKKPFFASIALWGLAALIMTGGLVASEARAQHASAVEGQSVRFKVSKPTATIGSYSSTSIRYHYSTVDDTAKAGEDYQTRIGYAVFGASAQYAWISVQTYSDDVDEGSGETFKLHLTHPEVAGAYRQSGQWVSAGSSLPQWITLTGEIMEPQ